MKDKEKENFLKWLVGFIDGEGCFTFLTTCIRIRITKLSDIKKLIIILDGYSLRTKKKEDYLLWKKGIELISNKSYLTKESKEKLKEIRGKINHYERNLNTSRGGGSSKIKEEKKCK